MCHRGVLWPVHPAHFATAAQRFALRGFDSVVLGLCGSPTSQRDT